MYHPSSTSSSSHGSMGPSGSTNSGLMRYGSAPSSVLSTTVDSITGQRGDQFTPFGSPHQPHIGAALMEHQQKGINVNTSIGLQRSYNGVGSGIASSSSTSGSPLVRHSSSPAGFLDHLAHAAASSNDDNGNFQVTRASGISRLNSQLSFTRQETLPQISEENENVTDLNIEINGRKKSTHSYATTSYNENGRSWGGHNAIMFSMEPSKRAKNVSLDIVNGLTSMESQFQFGVPQTKLEISTMDKYMNIPEDSVPCKIRAKRGFATHPRSIAERERRTRISGKLKKLQELVPNMDKQTSYADMLDLAVRHIKGLQDQVQNLNKELENCSCGCKRELMLTKQA